MQARLPKRKILVFSWANQAIGLTGRATSVDVGLSNANGG